MDRVDPVRPRTHDDAISAVARVADVRVRRETPEEAHDRRGREQRERARRQAARAWADSQRQALEARQETAIEGDDESDDGHAHVDIRV